MDTSSAGASQFGFSKLSEGWGTEMKFGKREDELCEEKKVYYRVISGESPSAGSRCPFS